MQIRLIIIDQFLTLKHFRVQLVCSRQSRSPDSSHPSWLNTFNKPIRKFRNGVYDCFAYFIEFGGRCITAKDDTSEIGELNRGVQRPREFFVNESFYPLG